MFERTDNVGLCVTDLARVVAFRERLGFAKAFENKRGITTTAGSTELFRLDEKDLRLSRWSLPDGMQAVGRQFADDAVFAAFVRLKPWRDCYSWSS